MTALADVRPEAAPAPAASAPASAARRVSRTVYRLRLSVVCLALVAAAFVQDPGLVLADTKLDLTQGPWAFLGRALHLWDPQGQFGQLQNQAYGYLWPMGPFYGALTTAGVPPWVVQRLWWALLLLLAFLGTVRLARLLGVRSPLARVLAGLAYALAPHVVGSLGPRSVEAWPTALVPWLLVPLVIGSRRGSPRRWAAVSGLVLVCGGGVNAMGTLSMLPLGVLWLLTREGGQRRRALAGWWALAVVLATTWWVLPLVLLGRYSPPFLDWIESASITTSTADAAASLRGQTNWLAYLSGLGGPTWPAAFSMVTSVLWVVAAAGVAAVGTAGLLRPRAPERTFLVLGAVTGLSLLVLGHQGSGAGLAGIAQPLLDGVLSPARNLHKVDGTLRLPLALGLGFAVEALLAWRPARRGADWPGGRWLRSAGIGVVCATIGLAASPVLSGEVGGHVGFERIPGFWSDAAAWLGNLNAQGRALVVPSGSSGGYLWGTTADEPMQPLASTPWAVRDSLPITAAGTIRWLDAAMERLATGRPSAGLADDLARGGVRYLVVRNDYDTVGQGAPRLVLVHQAIEGSPGITPVARFGPDLTPQGTTETSLDAGLSFAYPAVQIFAVSTGWASPDARVALRDLTKAVTSTASAESVLPLADAGVLQGRPLVAPGTETGTPVATDGPRRRELDFGLAQLNRSSTLSAEDPWVLRRRVHDFPMALPDSPPMAAEARGGTVSATSTRAAPGTMRAVRPGAAPWAALDHDLRTAWLPAVSDLLAGAATWSVSWDSPRSVAGLTVAVAADPVTGQRPESITVVTDHGAVVHRVGRADVPELVAVPPGASAHLSIQLGTMTGEAGDREVGLREVAVPGWRYARPLQIGTVPAGAPVVLGAAASSTPGCVLLFSRHACYPGLVATSDESAGLDRLLTMKAAQDFSVEITAHPRSGAALSRLVTAPAGGASAIASSTMVDEVADQPAAAIDGDPETAWVAGFGDPTPSLTLRWPTPRPITGIRLASPFSLVSSRPLSVTVQVDGGTSVPRVISPAGLLAVSAKAARSVTLTFTNRFPVETLDPVRGVWVTMPMGVAEVSVLGGPPVAAPVSTYPAVVGRCGTGPALEVDGVTVRTRFTTTLADLRNGVDVKVEPCRGGVRLAAGDHRIRVLSSPGLEVAAVRFQPIETPPPAAITTSPEVIDWQAADRTVAVRAALMPRTLELAESTNPGWTATMGTTVLAPVVVDGWRQAWVVPAGADGQVHLEFVPDRTYRRGLVVGLLAVVVLVGLAAAPRRRTPPAPAGPSSRWGQAVAVLALLAAVWTAGWAGAVAAAAAWLLLRRRPRGAPWVAAGGVLLSALPAAGWVWPSGGAPAVTWWLAAAGVGAALGAMAAVVGRGRQESDLDPSAGTAALG